MKLHTVWRIAALTLVFALVAGVAPVYATTALRGAVANNVSFAGTSLQGSDEASVTAFIEAHKPAVPALQGLTITAAGKTFTFDSNQAVAVDVAAMVNQAYATVADPSAAYSINPAYKVQTSVVNAWIATVAKAVYREKKSAKRVLKKKRLKLVKEVLGRSVDRSATSKLIVASLAAAAANPSVAPAAVAAPVKTYKPKVTSKNIDKAILVVLKERRIYLYKGAKLEKTYRCAIGTSKYPTPTGTWKIVRKVKNPTWRNPAPNGWGANMPAVIGPGPRNPLGMRALYLNASGIRIHGTYKSSSIGHAASHGCMRMTHKTVADLYPRVPVGTPVTIVK